MGRKRQIADPQMVSFPVHREDWEYLRESYPSIGAAGAVRALIRQHVQQLRAAKAAAAEETALLPELEL